MPTGNDSSPPSSASEPPPAEPSADWRRPSARRTQLNQHGDDIRSSEQIARLSSGPAASMVAEESAIEGVWLFSPRPYLDDGGRVLEWFSHSALGDLAGFTLPLAQASCSVSAAGVLRGLHSARVPPGQAKYVTCVRGAVYDVAVDLRIGSPTYGRWVGFILDDEDRRAVYLTEGIGHGFLALEPETTMIYLCAQVYAPTREFDINPLDPDLGIAWPRVDRQGRALSYTLSEKDRRAPSLAQVHAAGLLPTFADCLDYRRHGIEPF